MVYNCENMALILKNKSKAKKRGRISFRFKHKRASTRKERDEFRGSKYVQSDLNGIFVQVKDEK